MAELQKPSPGGHLDRVDGDYRMWRAGTEKSAANRLGGEDWLAAPRFSELSHEVSVIFPQKLLFPGHLVLVEECELLILAALVLPLL